MSFSIQSVCTLYATQYYFYPCRTVKLREGWGSWGGKANVFVLYVVV